MRHVDGAAPAPGRLVIGGLTRPGAGGLTWLVPGSGGVACGILPASHLRAGLVRAGLVRAGLFRAGLFHGGLLLDRLVFSRGLLARLFRPGRPGSGGLLIRRDMPSRLRAAFRRGCLARSRPVFSRPVFSRPVSGRPGFGQPMTNWLRRV
jgi:hypothetical protein